MSPGFLSSIFFDGRFFSKHRTDHVRCFSALWDKRFPTEISDNPFLWKDVSIPEFLWNTEGFPYESFLVMWDQSFERISWYTPLLLSKRFCGTRIFLKHRSVSPRNFSVLWEKKLSTENIEIPLLSVSFFESRFFMKQRRLAIPGFSGLWDTDFDKKSWYTPLFSNPKTFSIL